MNNVSLDEILDVNLPAAGNSGEGKVTFNNPVILAGITVTDDLGNTPKNVQIEVLKNSNPVIKRRHIEHYRLSAGGKAMDRFMPLWIGVKGEYTIRVTHDTANLAEDHNLNFLFKVVPENQVHLFKD
jgi:hypothetical protein